MTTPLSPSVAITAPDAPCAFISCLACYNEGRLVGEWFDAVDAAGVTTSQLHGRPIPVDTHEELWCMDVENMPVNREMDPNEARLWGDLFTDVGEKWPALRAWIRAEGFDQPGEVDVRAFEDVYQGDFEDWDSFAWSWVTDSGLQDGWPEEAIRYFNFDSWARDLRHSYNVERRGDGGVFIFRND